ncbi:MoxR-like ATPase [Marinobacter sp. DSM 26671]|jgi:MoxR-like ATPase|uniref:MoxR family ATPase n=3 Tax=Marinobacter TaxID=2742 RepID=A0A3D8H7X6_9GAMM|nr:MULTISPECIES: MoxR family ATPase [Marinobacter]MCP4063354.1 MoxR family ATPase [Gammaproteobacteria bacterium]MEC7727923.1 MoxR family ATPase [Pseudomonadota bacterium]HAP54336.1 MoxR family ATPase [Marinobacter adhaerens]AKV94950.1 ATPase AAA [Marinobacter sp. CP1]EHJ04518.1 ATPase [Marinobacter manganoxydans MnI7-9]|tara:strand:+ start:442 stop:1404 length:963 start_codon:yes stop_codon:yes gene_type:complete
MSLQHTFGELREQLAKRIIGQEKLVDRLLIALLADGHLLVEGAPGLAKTTAIKALADHLEGDFHRIQFTPDLLPSDVMGSEIYRPETGQFEFQRGPIFHNLVLADEINRAPAKVQSALLEAMGERQISVGMRTFPLDRLFLVMATQNPIEQEGTYPLPEAQLDRFLMHVVIHYPSAEAEKAILQLARNDYRHGLPKTDLRLTPDQVFDARAEVANIYMAEPVEQYLLALVLATRDPAALDPELARWTAFGASPRGTIALDRCARALAWLDGRDYVTPDDVRAMAFDVLRHRILLTFEAEAEGMTADTVIERLIERVPVSA